MKIMRILGLQIIFILMVFGLWSCAGSAIPDDLKQDAIGEAVVIFSEFGQVVNFKVTKTSLDIIGSGTPLSDDVDAGVEAAFCAKVYIDYEKENFSDKEDSSQTWELAYIFKKLGDNWSFSGLTEEEWLMYSCPGNFKE